MKSNTQATVASAALSAFLILGGLAQAADLGTSINSEYVSPTPQFVRTGAGPCYVRADVAYTVSSDPDIKWDQTDPVTGDYLTSDVRTLNFDNGWSGEVGAGCGSGSRGWRGELMLGYHGPRQLDGEPATTWYVPANGGPAENDPLHTDITSYTMMVNAYRDLGVIRGFTPYLGAGIGVAYNKVDDVYFTGNPALVNSIHGNNDISFAWSLMAGVGYQVSERAILDFGYRYLDLGSAESERVDSANQVNPRVNIDDISGHEFKVGLRYHFGSGEPDYAPMK